MFELPSQFFAQLPQFDDNKRKMLYGDSEQVQLYNDVDSNEFREQFRDIYQRLRRRISDRLGLAEETVCSYENLTEKFISNELRPHLLEVKEEIEKIYYQLTHSELSDNKERETLQNIKNSLDVCGPGLHTHLVDEAYNLSRENSVSGWFVDMRTQIFSRLCSRHCERNRVVESMEIHVSVIFGNYACDQKWAIRGENNKKVNWDPYAVARYLAIDEIAIVRFHAGFNGEFYLANIVDWFVNEICCNSELKKDYQRAVNRIQPILTEIGISNVQDILNYDLDKDEYTFNRAKICLAVSIYMLVLLQNKYPIVVEVINKIKNMQITIEQNDLEKTFLILSDLLKLDNNDIGLLARCIYTTLLAEDIWKKYVASIITAEEKQPQGQFTEDVMNLTTAENSHVLDIVVKNNYDCFMASQQREEDMKSFLQLITRRYVPFSAYTVLVLQRIVDYIRENNNVEIRKAFAKLVYLAILQRNYVYNDIAKRLFLCCSKLETSLALDVVGSVIFENLLADNNPHTEKAIQLIRYFIDHIGYDEVELFIQFLVRCLVNNYLNIYIQAAEHCLDNDDNSDARIFEVFESALLRFLNYRNWQQYSNLAAQLFAEFDNNNTLKKLAKLNLLMVVFIKLSESNEDIMQATAITILLQIQNIALCRMIIEQYMAPPIPISAARKAFLKRLMNECDDASIPNHLMVVDMLSKKLSFADLRENGFIDEQVSRLFIVEKNRKVILLSRILINIMHSQDVDIERIFFVAQFLSLQINSGNQRDKQMAYLILLDLASYMDFKDSRPHDGEPGYFKTLALLNKILDNSEKIYDLVRHAILMEEERKVQAAIIIAFHIERLRDDESTIKLLSPLVLDGDAEKRDVVVLSMIKLIRFNNSKFRSCVSMLTKQPLAGDMTVMLSVVSVLLDNKFLLTEDEIVEAYNACLTVWDERALACLAPQMLSTLEDCSGNLADSSDKGKYLVLIYSKALSRALKSQKNRAGLFIILDSLAQVDNRLAQNILKNIIYNNDSLADKNHDNSELILRYFRINNEVARKLAIEIMLHLYADSVETIKQVFIPVFIYYLDHVAIETLHNAEEIRASVNALTACLIGDNEAHQEYAASKTLLCIGSNRKTVRDIAVRVLAETISRLDIRNREAGNLARLRFILGALSESYNTDLEKCKEVLVGVFTDIAFQNAVNNSDQIGGWNLICTIVNSYHVMSVDDIVNRFMRVVPDTRVRLKMIANMSQSDAEIHQSIVENYLIRLIKEENDFDKLVEFFTDLNNLYFHKSIMAAISSILLSNEYAQLKERLIQVIMRVDASIYNVRHHLPLFEITTNCVSRKSPAELDFTKNLFACAAQSPNKYSNAIINLLNLVAMSNDSDFFITLVLIYLDHNQHLASWEDPLCMVFIRFFNAVNPLFKDLAVNSLVRVCQQRRDISYLLFRWVDSGDLVVQQSLIEVLASCCNSLGDKGDKSYIATLITNALGDGGSAISRNTFEFKIRVFQYAAQKRNENLLWNYLFDICSEATIYRLLTPDVPLHLVESKYTSELPRYLNIRVSPKDESHKNLQRQYVRELFEYVIDQQALSASRSKGLFVRKSGEDIKIKAATTLIAQMLREFTFENISRVVGQHEFNQGELARIANEVLAIFANEDKQQDLGSRPN